jgi:hypothetical protein
MPVPFSHLSFFPTRLVVLWLAGMNLGWGETVQLNIHMDAGKPSHAASVLKKLARLYLYLVGISPVIGCLTNGWQRRE